MSKKGKNKLLIPLAILAVVFAAAIYIATVKGPASSGQAVLFTKQYAGFEDVLSLNGTDNTLKICGAPAGVPRPACVETSTVIAGSVKLSGDNSFKTAMEMPDPGRGGIQVPQGKLNPPCNGQWTQITQSGGTFYAWKCA